MIAALSLAGLLVSATVAKADKRVAFVVGNGSYKNVPEILASRGSVASSNDGDDEPSRPARRRGGGGGRHYQGGGGGGAPAPAAYSAA